MMPHFKLNVYKVVLMPQRNNPLIMFICFLIAKESCSIDPIRYNKKTWIWFLFLCEDYDLEKKTNQLLYYILHACVSYKTRIFTDHKNMPCLLVLKAWWQAVITASFSWI